MSTAISDVRDPGHGGEAPLPPDPTRAPAGAEEAPQQVVVRRNAGLAALVGAAGSAVSIAYLWRATQAGAVLDWVLCALMALVAVVHLAHLVDARTPLLVADDLGLRIRLGHQWCGLPWAAVGSVAVQPPRGLLRDGRVVVVPRSPADPLEGLDARARRAAGLNAKAHGAVLAVPLGLTTRVARHGAELAGDLAALSGGQVDVRLGGPARPAEPGEPADVGDGPADPPQPADLGDVAGDRAEPAVWTDRDLRTPEPSVPGQRPAGPRGTSPLRGIRALVRTQIGPAAGDQVDAGGAPEVAPPAVAAEVARELGPELGTAGSRGTVRGAPVLGATALAGGSAPQPLVLPEHAELRRAPHGGLDGLHDEGRATRRAPLADVAPEPAADPVIGPELAEARVRVGLSVDELAERTRIRPHVIESIEVDDFVPCGGDFYARGHLRTLARVLGRDPVPLLQHFDERYASAPVSARRVFEAEMATGMTGSMRSTVGGPRWTLLVAAVLALVVVWGVVRLFGSEPAEVLAPVPVIDGPVAAGAPSPGAEAAEPSPPATVPPVTVTLRGAQDGSQVVVRDRAGRVAWAGEVRLGEQRTVQVVPPVEVRAVTGGVIEVSLNDSPRGLVGEPGGPAVRTLHRFVR